MRSLRTKGCNMTILNVEIPNELNQVLESVAKKLDFPKVYIVNQALINYLQELQEKYSLED
jgi:predicted transcriptional regulator